MQGAVSKLFAQKVGHRVTQGLPDQPSRQMPEIFRSQTLYRVALGELAEDGMHAVAQLAQEGTISRVGVFGLTDVWSHQLKSSQPKFLGHGGEW